MQRYFPPIENWQENSVIITGKDIHHITNVMRNKEDDQLICIHPSGKIARSSIKNIEKDKIVLIILDWLENDYELPIEVTIVQGLPKGSKLELIVQKATELGAGEIQLYEAERSISKWDHKKGKNKLNRYEKIVKEASEQSYRNMIPAIKPPEKLERLLEKYSTHDHVFFAYEETAKSSKSSRLKTYFTEINPGHKVVVFIGPEGGFSKKEVEIFNLFKCKPIRLGKRILRTETASMYFLSAISYHLEE